MGFADCKKIALAVSGNIPDSEIFYGLYTPTTPRDTWDPRWAKGFADSFTHFWVESNGQIIDNALEQFGGVNTITSVDDIHYVKVGKYIKETDRPIPLVENPSIKWSTLSKDGRRVEVIWEGYDDYLAKVRSYIG